MAYRAASDVAEMESDVFLLRSEKEALTTQVALLTQERDQAKIELALMAARMQEELVRATQMETIMSQVSMGLVAGLQKMHQAKMHQRAARRIIQERELEAETGDMPDSWRAGEDVQQAQHEPAALEGQPQPRDLDERPAPTAEDWPQRPGNKPGPYLGADRLVEKARTTIDAAELVGRPVHREPPQFLKRIVQASEPNPDITDHPLLPPAAGLKSGAEAGELKALSDRLLKTRGQ